MTADRPALIEAFRNAGAATATATGFARELDEFMRLPAGSLWLTFAHGRLWWALAGPDVHALGAGAGHGFRARSLLGPWSDRDLAGRPLTIDSLSGRLTKLGAYRQSVCTVAAAEYAVRVINALPSQLLLPAREAYAHMVKATGPLIADLDPVDFEILIDMILSRNGWSRVGRVGGAQPDSDIVAIQPITGERAFVQVKASATPSILRDYVTRFRKQAGYTRMIFAVHTAVGQWPEAEPDVLVWRGDALSEMVLRSGLYDWLLAKCG